MNEIAETDHKAITVTASQARFVSWISDILVYTVVLNLFVEYSEAIVIDSFTISILTAVLLKALLDAIKGVEHRVSQFWRQREGTVNRVLGILSVFAILFLSKFVILEVVDLVFRDHVELGHFLDVVFLIITMIVARLLMDWIYQRIGEASPAE